VLGIGLEHDDGRRVLGQVRERLAERCRALLVVAAAAAERDGARRREGRQPAVHGPFSISSIR
jgi:hypothetical protein